MLSGSAPFIDGSQGFFDQGHWAGRGRLGLRFLRIASVRQQVRHVARFSVAADVNFFDMTQEFAVVLGEEITHLALLENCRLLLARPTVLKKRLSLWKCQACSLLALIFKMKNKVSLRF